MGSKKQKGWVTKTIRLGFALFLLCFCLFSAFSYTLAQSVPFSAATLAVVFFSLVGAVLSPLVAFCLHGWCF